MVKKGNKNWSQYHFQDLESSDKQILCLDRKKKNNEEMTSVYLIHIQFNSLFLNIIILEQPLKNMRSLSEWNRVWL